MNQREIQDTDKVIWTCVQAFSGTNGPAAKEAAKRVEENGMVPVVCTPSGGAQTIRLDLASDWMQTMTDQEIITAIEESQDKS